MFYCTLLYVHSCIAIILIGKRGLIALLNLSSWCLVMIERLFLAVPRGCLQFVIVVFPDYTHSLFFLSGTPKDKKYSSFSSKLELKGLVKPETASSTRSTLHLTRLSISFSVHLRVVSIY